ncbi:MAG TPA: SDR family oxidoreductase [Acidimicrobiales bacterium]|nr:SDR family oxidoreductase [Acidimicrobiales bacterium]
MKLEGRVALVTGASRGVGRAIALELARRGADVILAARTVSESVPGMPGTLSETAAEVQALGRQAHIVAADLTDTDSVQLLAEQALGWRGRVDVLVNNAAFLGRAAYHNLDELDLNNFVRQFTVNVTAPFILSKALVPTMRANGGGVIANVTSGAGIIGEYTVPGITYGSSKAALNRLTTLLARDLADDNIVVFALDPAYTRTVLVEQTAAQAGLDASEAHEPEVPARLLADLVEAGAEVSTGRIFKTVEGKGPVLMADSREPMPEGVELDLAQVTQEGASA